MEIKQLKELVFMEYIKNEYLTMWDAPTINGHPEWQMFFDLAEAGLIHTEPAELQEAIRDQNREEMVVECADIIIRTLNFCSRLQLPIEKALINKHEKNMKRKKLHGREI